MSMFPVQSNSEHVIIFKLVKNNIENQLFHDYTAELFLSCKMMLNSLVLYIH